MTNEEELIEIERALTYQDKMIKELNAVVIEQGREIDRLKRIVACLTESSDAALVKPQSEETRPPHY